MGRFTARRTDLQIFERVYSRTDRSIDRTERSNERQTNDKQPADKRTERQRDGRLYRQMNGITDKWMDLQIAEPPNERKNREFEGRRANRLMDELTESRTDSLTV